MNLTRLENALRALTALATAVAVGAFVWRPSVPAVVIAPAGFDALPAARPSTGIDEPARQAIVDADIFSAARRAPAVRYDPFGAEARGLPDPTPGRPDDAVPQLYGTMVGPGGASALMRLDAGTPDAQLYRVGDRGGTYRVEQIDEDSVILSGPRGRVVLRLTHPQESVR